MRARSNPPRLAEQPQLNELLHPAAERQIDQARLERSRQLLFKRLAEMSKEGASSQRKDNPLTRKAFFIRVVVPVSLLFSVVAVGGYFVHSYFIPSEQPMVAPDNTKKVELPPGSSSPRSDGFPVQPVDTSTVDLLPRGKTPQPKVAKATRVPMTAQTEADHPASELPLQIELLRKAEGQASDGRYDQALAMLDELLQRYPYTPLKPEAQYDQVEWLFFSGQYRQAIQHAQKLLSQPELGGKKAQLYRIMGDCYLHLDQCLLAQESFRRALGLGLEGDQAEAARRGIKKCK